MVIKLIDNKVLLAAVAFVLLLYFLTNHPFGQVHIVQTSLDTKIPFLPIFAVPYLLFLPALVGTIFYAYVSKNKFKALAFSLIITYTLSYAVYFLYQTYVPRPVVNGHDIFSDLVRWIYSHDQPYNGLPSTHASGAIILAAYYLAVRRIVWVVIPFSFAVLLSTLLIKQHFILDVVSSIILSGVVSWQIFHHFASFEPGNQ